MENKKNKILVIEDDKFLLKLYANQLKRSGFNVISSLNGEEGLKKVLAEKPDLVLLDLVLPRKNGFEVLSEIKSNPKTKNIPVIILTNLSQVSDLEMGIKLGAQDYIVKTDFSINELPIFVKKHLVKAKKKARE